MNRQLSTGYISKPHCPDHKVFGSANQIGGTPLEPSGQWTAFLPPLTEEQDIGVEPEDCTSEGTLGAVEILARSQYDDDTVWSKRFLAYISGTTQQGNDPMAVASTLKAKGTVPESDWPNTAALKTWADFYAIPPQKLYGKALEFVAQYAFDKEWVATDAASLMAALQFSPVGVAGYAWAEDENGLYYTPPSAEPCHWFVIVGFVANNYWIIFDSYENDIKHLRWDYVFSEAMRYSLAANVASTPVAQSAWQKFLAYMQQITDQMQNSLGIRRFGRTFGAARSPEWPRVRREHLEKEPTCRVCGGTSKLNVHHLLPFHMKPELELDPTNLITLCEGNKTLNCHLRFGHLDNFATKWNPNIREEAQVWLKRFSAKTEAEIC